MIADEKLDPMALTEDLEDLRRFEDGPLCEQQWCKCHGCALGLRNAETTVSAIQKAF